MPEPAGGMGEPGRQCVLWLFSVCGWFTILISLFLVLSSKTGTKKAARARHSAAFAFSSCGHARGRVFLEELLRGEA
jgi:hypothetical protein